MRLEDGTVVWMIKHSMNWCRCAKSAESHHDYSLVLTVIGYELNVSCQSIYECWCIIWVQARLFTPNCFITLIAMKLSVTSLFLWTSVWLNRALCGVQAPSSRNFSPYDYFLFQKIKTQLRTTILEVWRISKCYEGLLKGAFTCTVLHAWLSRMLLLACWMEVEL